MARDVKIAILGDARNFSRAIGVANRDAQTLGSRLRGMSGLAKAAFGGATVAAIAFGKSSVDAFQEAEEAQSQLSAAYAKFPQLAGKNADALRELNTQLARKTKFDDDATASAQAVLAGFGLTEDQLLKVTPLLQDYAEKTGKDLPSAAQDIGKAILGQGRALKAVGINFKDTGTAAGNFEQIMGGLTDKVGGFAEVAGGTSTGKVAILRNQFEELQEKVGSALVPALLKVVDVFLQDVLPAIDKVTAIVQRNWPMIQQTITEAVQKIVDFVTPLVHGLQALWENFGNNILSFVERVWPRVQQIIGGALEIIRGIIKTVTSLIQGDWAGVWEGIKQIVHGAWTFIQGIVGAALEALRTIIGVGLEIIGSLVKGAFDGIIGFVRSVPGRMAAAGSGMFDWIKETFRSAINWVIDKWNDFELKVNIPDAIPGLPDEFKVTTPNIPRFDNGGIMPGPRGVHRLALVAGGETILPTHKGGAGAGVTININGNVDRSVLADAVYELRKGQLAMAG